jgi:predicted nucleic acid-binding protein
MTRRKGLVLDANILLRAVFGVRVRALLETYEEEVSFYWERPVRNSYHQVIRSFSRAPCRNIWSMDCERLLGTGRDGLVQHLA